MGTNSHLWLKDSSKVCKPSIIKEKAKMQNKPLAFIVDFYLKWQMSVFKIYNLLSIQLPHVPVDFS
jgi:hypothetical protein